MSYFASPQHNNSQILCDFGSISGKVNAYMQSDKPSGTARTGDGEPSSVRAAQWPECGVAIEGDFSGIQRFVLRPVPGSSGAARRLRARSFRVLALTRLIAEAVREGFPGSELFYSAGGRFMVVAGETLDWEDRIRDLQTELDKDLLAEHRGELVFHLVGASFGDGRIPVEGLRLAMRLRRLAPLGRALRTSDGWAKDGFAYTRKNPYFRCRGCDMTMSGVVDSEGSCETCVMDRELGAALLGSKRLALAEVESDQSIRILDKQYGLSPDGHIAVRAIAHTPVQNGGLATFDELALRANGRRYLGFLRIDADHVGDAFKALGGDPSETRRLSNLLDEAFSLRVADMLQARFKNIYPVYGGGDDLFVIGPWDQALDFASAWRSEFRAITGNKIAFSAGMILAKPHQHILSKSEEAEEALSDAKVIRDSIHVFGCTIRWQDFEPVMDAARRLAKFHRDGQIRSAMLQNILDLHARWTGGPGRESDARWHPLLYYQVERNLQSQADARQFLEQAFLTGGLLWKHADFAVRYAMLSSGSEEGRA